MGNTALPRVGDAELQRLTALIEDALNALEEKPLANAVIIPVTFTAAYPAGVRVYHGLGRAPVGYFVVNTLNAFGWLTQIPTPNEPDPRNYITLGYGSTANTLIVVF
jgi:hypothetical protein